MAIVSLRKYVEDFGSKFGPKTWSSATRLCEDMGDDAMIPSVETPDEAEPGEEPGDLMDALMDALDPLLEDAFETGNSEKACSALRDFVKLHAKHKSGGGSAAPEPDADDMETPVKTESKSKKPADAWSILSECQTAGYTPTPTELKALSLMSEAIDRATFITDQRKKAAPNERPRSTSRQPGAGETGVVAESKKVVTDRKSFLESIRG